MGWPGCHGILARCCASQMQPFPFGTQRPESLLPQLARLSLQTVSWRASQKDPRAFVLPHGIVHQNHAWNSDQLHVWIDALSPNIDLMVAYPSLRVESEEIEVEVLRGLPPGL